MGVREKESGRKGRKNGRKKGSKSGRKLRKTKFGREEEGQKIRK